MEPVSPPDSPQTPPGNPVKRPDLEVPGNPVIIALIAEIPANCAPKKTPRIWVSFHFPHTFARVNADRPAKGLGEPLIAGSEIDGFTGIFWPENRGMLPISHVGGPTAEGWRVFFRKCFRKIRDPWKRPGNDLPALRILSRSKTTLHSSR